MTGDRPIGHVAGMSSFPAVILVRRPSLTFRHLAYCPATARPYSDHVAHTDLASAAASRFRPYMGDLRKLCRGRSGGI